MTTYNDFLLKQLLAVKSITFEDISKIHLEEQQIIASKIEELQDYLEAQLNTSQ
ncbi:MAG: hypothetical protein ABJN96_14140 [Marinomonas sp.]